MNAFRLQGTNIAALAGIALLVVSLGAAYFGMRSIYETLRTERLARSEVDAYDGLRLSLEDAGEVQRQYLLTGDAALQARFDTQRDRVRVLLADLGPVLEDPAQRSALPVLRTALAEHLGSLERAMAARRSQGTEVASRLAQGADTVGSSARAFEAIARGAEQARRLLRQRESAALNDLGFLERGILAGILLATGLLGWSMHAAKRQEAARGAAESALRARSRELRLVVDAVPAMISYIDSAERVLLHNRAYAQWLGLPASRIEGRTAREILGEQSYAEAAPYIARALAGEEVRYEREQRASDGSLRSLAVAYVPHRAASGELLGSYALLTDVTELKRLERMKSEFVAMVSHELRTPATAIRGALDLLAGGAAGALPEPVARLVGIAGDGCARLLRLVDDILDLEQIEGGSITFDLREQDPAALVSLALVAAGPVAAQRGVRLAMQPDAGAEKVHTDASRATQVLTKLLANAIQFTPAGGEVAVVIEPCEDAVRISVRDQGPGVGEAFRPLLFQRFSQEPGSARGITGRFGLGLAISRMLVERLRGRIGYEPASGGGSVFWFELPTARAGRARGVQPS